MPCQIESYRLTLIAFAVWQVAIKINTLTVLKVKGQGQRSAKSNQFQG